MRRIRSGVVLVLTLLGGPLSAEIVCVQAEWPIMFRESRIVALAYVSGEIREGGSTTFALKVVRNWKGNKKKLEARTEGGEDGGGLRVGDYVLVYANEAAFRFNSCNQPRPVYEERVQVAITALDRLRRYPPVSLPSAALKWPDRK